MGWLEKRNTNMKDKCVILYVHGTLKEGRRFHWMLRGCRQILLDPYMEMDGFEAYCVSKRLLWWLDIFEFLCGWRRIQKREGYAYWK